MSSRFRTLLPVAVAVALAVTGAACSANPGTPSSSGASTTLRSGSSAGTTGTVITRPRPSTTSGSTPGSTTGTIGTIVTRHLLDGFKEVTVTVTTADGQTLQWCLLLADTEPLREQGLMFVTDPTLGGYDGMLFSFGENVDGGFWMKNTILPLSLAYLNADGGTVSTTDMAPCPADAKTCPSYPSGGRYRNAIEVPQGELARLGIDEHSTVHVGGEGCASVPV